MYRQAPALRASSLVKLKGARLIFRRTGEFGAGSPFVMKAASLVGKGSSDVDD